MIVAFAARREHWAHVYHLPYGRIYEPQTMNFLLLPFPFIEPISDWLCWTGNVKEHNKMLMHLTHKQTERKRKPRLLWLRRWCTNRRKGVKCGRIKEYRAHNTQQERRHRQLWHFVGIEMKRLDLIQIKCDSGHD